MWKKIQIFVRFNWITIILSILGTAALIFTAWYIISTATNYFGLEEYSRKQISGHMGATLPMFLIVQIIAIGMMMFIQYWMFMGGGMGNLTKKKIDEAKMDVKWDDVIGMEDAKKEALEIVKLLKDRSAVKAIGGNIVKGTMMLGPPGCGKTYLAKAMATECGLPMLSAVGSEFVAMFMGQGAARIKSLFKQARKIAKIEGGCIVFIDEIDAFAQPRAAEKGFGATTSHNATVNQFLTELDGMRHKENNIIVIAATNADEDDLDSAIMRSGRFDRKIYVEKPNAEEREALIKYYLGRVDADETIDIKEFAEKAQWFSPSDINNMVREAGIIALRHSRTQIQTPDLKAGLDRVIASVEKMGGEKILSGKINVPWSSVIGMENVKREAWEIVELLRDHSRLKAVGGKIIKGVIMLGPPGCGKTYLAKAMATEAGYPFISRAGSEFQTMWVGEGAKKIREMFEEARKVAKAEGGCIIFIDEIDSFARPRGASPTENSASYLGVNQLLTEMDGLRTAENNIIVLAATNVGEHEVDSALMRPGRFDRKIHVTLPNLKDREDLFQFYLDKVQIEPDCNPKVLAQKTLYFSPAQIDSMVREAGLFALRDKREIISFKDLSNAYDRIMYGDKSNINLTEKEKIWTAYHEAGHAIIAYLIHMTNDVIKATIIPRKGSLGMVSQRPIEEIHSYTKEDLVNDIKVSIAAYVAEKMTFGSTSSGVGGGRGSDFDQAMRKARYMVWSLGMGESGLMGDFEATKDFHGRYQISQQTHETLDRDVQKILKDCIADVERILGEHKDLLKYFSEELIEKGELEYDEIEAIFAKFGLQRKREITETT